MSPSLTSTLSEFSKKSEFSKSGLAAELSNEPPLHPSELKRFLGARSFIRFLLIFFIGVSATLAWQSHGRAAREAIASWSPRLAWLAPPAARAGDSPDQIVAISRDLAAMRQSVDKLAADMTKLHAPQPVPVRKPSPQTR